MKLSGYSHIYSGLGQQAFPMPGQNRGRSFLDEVISATMTSSLEKVKKTKEQEAEDAQLRALYAYLSAASQSVLERVRDGKGGVRKDEWLTLCRELKDAGAISQSEFDRLRVPRGPGWPAEAGRETRWSIWIYGRLSWRTGRRTWPGSGRRTALPNSAISRRLPARSMPAGRWRTWWMD